MTRGAPLPSPAPDPATRGARYPWRPRLTPLHLGMLRALAQCDRLQRQVLVRTARLDLGQELACAGRRLRVEGVAGEGMMAITYRVRDLEAPGGSPPLALKRARAPIDVFRQALAAEARAARWLAEEGGLATAPVLASEDHQLLKPFFGGRSLKSFLLAGELEGRPREALLAVLEAGAEIHARRGFAADLSPKNLVWDEGRWVLLDTGEPLVDRGFAGAVLARPGLEAYLDYYRPRIEAGPARPSAWMAHRGGGPEPGELPGPRLFVRDFWMWIPAVAGEADEALRVSCSPEAPSREILLEARPEGEGWRARVRPQGDPQGMAAGELRRRAVAEWSEAYPGAGLAWDEGGGR